MKRPLVLPRVFQRLQRYDEEGKDGDQKKKKEEGRFWLKVSVQSEAKEKEEKVTEG